MSKQIINSMYGTCCTNTIKSNVLLDSIYVTAYVRRNLFERLDTDVVYYDTDSLEILKDKVV